MRSPSLFLLRWLLLSLTTEMAVFGRWLSEATIGYLRRHPDGSGLLVGRLLQPPILGLCAIARHAGRLNESLRRRWDAQS